MTRGRMILFGVLIVALVVRLMAAVAVQQHVGEELCLIKGDAKGYWDLAGQIATGGEFSIYDPPRRVHRMPGFPVVLAVSRVVFGENRLAARGLLALIGTATCAAVYFLGRTLFDERTGLLACVVTAVSPAMVVFSVLFLSETLFALTLLLSVWGAARWWQATRSAINNTAWYWSFVTGATLALATLVRPSALLAGPALALAVIVFGSVRSRRVTEAAVMLLALFGLLLPWAARNQRVCGHWVFTTLWSGPSLYDGLSSEATGESNMAFFDRDNLMATMSEWDVDQHYRQAAWRFVMEQPRRALELTLIKCWRYWKPWPNAAQFGGIGPAILIASAFMPLIGFAMFAVWRSTPSWQVLALTAGPILYFAAIHAVFIGSLRYRLPTEYPLAVLSAAGVLNWLDRWPRPSSQVT